MKKVTRNTILLTVIILFQIQLVYGGNKKAEKLSDYLTMVREYADVMISYGRDTYGTEQSSLFASTLNRETLQLGSKSEIGEIEGVRKTDRSLTGANLIHDVDLFQILYKLSDITGEKKYSDEADKAFTYFLEKCQSPATGLFCWGEHLFWDFFSDNCGHTPNYDFHEAKSWPFWDHFYEINPHACWKFVMGEWEHQIHDKTTGDFSRHGRYTKHETFSGFDFPRYAGQMIERWADAYNRPENASCPRKEELLHYIKVLFNRMQENSELSESGLLIAGRSDQGDHNSVVWLTNNLELARCLEAAAPTVSTELAEQMRGFALKQDEDFFNAPHKLDSAGGGFAVTLHAKTGLPRTRAMNKPYTSTWSSGYGYGTHAEVANICYARHLNLKKHHHDMANRYQEMILAAGEIYLNSVPDTTNLIKPNEFYEVIQLMLNCYDLTKQEEYLTRATFFAESGIDLFLNDNIPLPKATNKHNHYESITGGPSFMYELLRLHTMK